MKRWYRLRTAKRKRDAVNLAEALKITPVPILVREGQRRTKRTIEDGMLGSAKHARTRGKIIPIMTETGVLYTFRKRRRGRKLPTRRNQALTSLLMMTSALE